MKCRIGEHEKNIKEKKTKNSTLAEHILTKNREEKSKNHFINKTTVKIVGREPNHKRRKIQEAIEMQRERDNVISQASFDLHKMWLPLLPPCPHTQQKI